MQIEGVVLKVVSGPGTEIQHTELLKVRRDSTMYDINLKIWESLLAI